MNEKTNPESIAMLDKKTGISCRFRESGCRDNLLAYAEVHIPVASVGIFAVKTVKLVRAPNSPFGYKVFLPLPPVQRKCPSCRYPGFTADRYCRNCQVKNEKPTEFDELRDDFHPLNHDTRRNFTEVIVRCYLDWKQLTGE